jgi:hypothetical protein
MLFKEEADSCRRKADEYIGRPEAPFLLKVARAFDELAISERASAMLDRRDAGQFVPRINA